MTVSLERIKQVRTAAFELARHNPRNYEVFRGLYTRTIQLPHGQKIMEGYHEKLPIFEGKKLGNLLGELVDQQPEVNWLDVGCANGHQFVDAHLKWRNVIGMGINACLFPLNDHPDLGEVTTQDFAKMGIDIKQGDAQELPTYYPENTFDIATSGGVGPYLGESWAMVQGMYDVLKPGGIALIREVPESLIDRPINESQKLWEVLESEYGFSYQQSRYDGGEWYYDIAFKKMLAPLDLPLEPWKVYLSFYDRENVIDYIIYKLKR